MTWSWMMGLLAFDLEAALLQWVELLAVK